MYKIILAFLSIFLIAHLFYNNMKTASKPTSVNIQVKLCENYIDFECKIEAENYRPLFAAKGVAVKFEFERFNYCQVIYETENTGELSLTCFKEYDPVAYTVRYHSFPLWYAKYSKCATMRLPTRRKIGENYFIVGCVRNDK